MSNILLILAAGPAIALCIYVFSKDRVEKEPLGLLLSLMFFGALIAIPVSIFESKLSIAIDNFFANFAVSYTPDGYYVLTESGNFWYNAAVAFIGVALIEEGFKWIVLFIITRNNKNFNSYFDGIVYAVFVSLGFALLENVLYVFDYGFSTGLSRMFTAIPGHFFFAVMMGWNYSNWHVRRDANRLIDRLMLPNSIPCNKYLANSLIVPVLLHGFYDLCCFNTSEFWSVVFIVFLIIMYIFCFNKVRQLSKADAPGAAYSIVLAAQANPEHRDRIAAYVESLASEYTTTSYSE